MSRSVEQLRQAVKDEGWEGHPLADEILETMNRLEADRATAAAAARPSQSARAAWGVAGVLALAVVGGAAWAFSSQGKLESDLYQQRQQQIATVAQKDQEIARLKELNAAQMSEAATRIQAALNSADSVSKNSATLADSNREMLKSLTAEIQRLQAALQAEAQQRQQPAPQK